MDLIASLITKQVSDLTDAYNGKVKTDDGTHAFLIKDGKITTDLPHNVGDITMVSILSIIGENLQKLGLWLKLLYITCF